jgi:amino acid transporter
MDTQAEKLSGDLTTFKIVTMVVAAAAPMGAVVGIIPLGLAIGSGSSTPAVFVLAGALLLAFAVGYAAMSKQVSSAGGFYTYVSKGLGRPAGMAAAVLAIAAYCALTLLLVAGVGYFGNLVLDLLTGASVPWWAFSAVAVAVIGFMGIREINVAGSVLVPLLALELVVLLVLDISIVAHKGFDAFPLAAMDPTNMFTTGSFGLGLMFAFSTFLGFESAAIYAEESRNPARSIPRATYLSVVVIAGFYALTAWVTVGALAVANTQVTASEQLGGLYFGLSDQYASSVLTKIMYATLITSLFASMLALHNAASRYLFSVGRERALLPGWIGTAHHAYDTPARASVIVTTVSALVALAFAISGADPYLNMGTMMTGLGTLALVSLQALAAAAIVAYFWRRSGPASPAVIGAGIGAVALAAAAVLIVKNFQTLSGSTSTWINVLPWALLAASIAGALYGLWLRTSSPEAYARIGTCGEAEGADPVTTSPSSPAAQN